MATIDGAKVLGLDHLVGSLEVGKRADVIIVDLQQPHLQPLYQLASQLVYSADGRDVETVIVDGRLLMDQGKLLTLNKKSIMSRLNTYQDKVTALKSSSD